jgi:hypothetical protein
MWMIFSLQGKRDSSLDARQSLASKFEITNIGLMHYFLGFEVWQEPGNIFLGHGKYVCDILRRFQMEDYRPMTTPMITTWKKLHASESQLVDSTLYHQFIVWSILGPIFVLFSTLSVSSWWSLGECTGWQQNM